MKRLNIFIFILIITATSCATKYYIDQNNQYKKYRNELVSVETALQLAKNSYILACIKAKKEEDSKKHYMKTCVGLASRYVSETVEFILEK